MARRIARDARGVTRYATAMEQQPRSDRIMLALAIRAASALLLALNNALVKLVEARGAHLSEVMFFRQVVSVPVVAILVAAGPGLATLKTTRIGAHAVRMVFGVAAMTLLYYAVGRLALPEVTTLSFTVPAFATLLGALWLGEPTGWRRWSAVAMGFVGVLIIVRPGHGAFDPAGIAAGLGYALVTALTSIQLRQIGATEKPTTTVFWFALLSVPVLLPFLIADARPHPPIVWAMLTGVGLLGAGTQIALTAALRYGPVSTVVTMDYSGLIWATLLGWLIFALPPTIATLIGAPLVIGSGLYIVWRERVVAQRTAAKAEARLTV